MLIVRLLILAGLIGATAASVMLAVELVRDIEPPATRREITELRREINRDVYRMLDCKLIRNGFRLAEHGKLDTSFEEPD